MLCVVCVVWKHIFWVFWWIIIHTLPLSHLSLRKKMCITYEQIAQPKTFVHKGHHSRQWSQQVCARTLTSMCQHGRAHVVLGVRQGQSVETQSTRYRTPKNMDTRRTTILFPYFQVRLVSSIWNSESTAMFAHRKNIDSQRVYHMTIVAGTWHANT